MMKKSVLLAVGALGALSLAACSLGANGSSSEAGANSSFSGASSSLSPSSMPSSSSSATVAEEETAPTVRGLYDNSFSSNNIPDQWEGYGVGDPFVYRYNGTYYLYCSTKDGETGIKAWKSTDLIHWGKCTGTGLSEGYVSADAITLTAYAPEVIYSDGFFYLITSPAGNGHYVLKASSPEGPFVSITSNFGQSIDGSFFQDDDESVYLLRANAGNIKMMKLKSDFTPNALSSINVANTTIGNWTEGPYLLRRFGNDYLTYTGVNVTSAGYRIGYSYASGEAFQKNGYAQDQKNLVLSTNANYNGLGHSATVMGPNMDSYFMSYHNLINSGGPVRGFCLNRLYFNGTDMIVSHPKLQNNVTPEAADFASYAPTSDLVSSDGFLLSSSSTENEFTTEYNIIGDSTKMVFSYANSSNYAYLSWDGSSISLHKVVAGSDSLVNGVTLSSAHPVNVNHTFRAIYRNGVFNATFDNMTKISNLAITLSAGKIGYSESSDVLGFTGYSNHAFGDSDNADFKQGEVLANSYDLSLSDFARGSVLSEVTSANGEALVKNGSYDLSLKAGDTARYLTYFDADGYYGLSLRLPLSMMGKSLLIGVDGTYKKALTVPTYAISEATYGSLEVGRFAIAKGSHYIDIKAIDDLSFNSFAFTVVTDSVASFANDLATLGGEAMEYANVWKIKNGGHFAQSGNRQLLYIGGDTITNLTMECTISLDGTTGTNTAGLLVRTTNAAFSTFDSNDSIQGYYCAINNSKAIIQRKDYSWTALKASSTQTLASDTDIKLKVVVKGNSITLSLNGVEAITYSDPDIFPSGHVGLYTDGAAATFKNLSISLG